MCFATKASHNSTCDYTDWVNITLCIDISHLIDEFGIQWAKESIPAHKSYSKYFRALSSEQHEVVGSVHVITHCYYYFSAVQYYYRKQFNSHFCEPQILLDI